MRTNLIILALLFIVCNSVNGQTRLLDFTPPPPDTLDYSIIRSIYEQRVLSDTLKSQKYIKELMILQIGSKGSKYMSHVSFRTDSLIADDTKKRNNVDLIQAVQNGRYKFGDDRIILFKNFPTRKNTILNRIAYDNYIYDENIVAPEWKIGKDKETILGYSCLKATTTFCGRNYIAWFTPDIAVNEGPWKFTGLPGLILKVNDDRGEVSFECTQLENVGWRDPILKSPISRSTIKTTKENFYKQLKKYCDNPSGFRANSTRKTSTGPEKIRPKILYNPIELSE